MFLASKRRRFGGLLPNPPSPATAARPQRAATGSHRRLFHLNGSHSSTSSCNNGSKSIKFLKKTLSFTDTSSMLSTKVVPKGFLVVCVGKEQKRFIIPTEYLGHQAFGVLLREVEEESDFSRRVCSRSHVKWLCLRGSWRVCSRSDQWFKFQFVIINWPWRKEISHSPPPLPSPPRPVVVAAPTFYFYVLLLLYLLLNVLFLFIYHNFDKYCKILDIYIF